MKRIIYKYNLLNQWYESSPILTGHGYTIAGFQGLNWRLVSYDSGLVICEGKSKSSHMLKKNIKKELISRGAIFEDEIRKI